VTNAAWELTDSLDAYLREVVLTLKQATDRGMRHLDDQQVDVERTIGECEQILDVIMHGDVSAWVGDDSS
jgi:hypothetical protein